MKFNQPKTKNPTAKALEGHNDYETDSYNNFGDVDDFEHLSSDAGQPKLSASSFGSSQKPLFLIKTSEYLSGYKERVLGE